MDLAGVGEIAGKVGTKVLSGFEKAGTGISAGAEKVGSKYKVWQDAREAAKFEKAAKTGENIAKDGTKATTEATKEATKAATEDAAGKKGSKAWKIAKGVGGAGLTAGGALVKGGSKAVGKATHAVLGKKGGLTSMLKMGGLGALFALLINPAFKESMNALASAGKNMKNLHPEATTNAGTQNTPNFFDRNLNGTTSSNTPASSAAATSNAATATNPVNQTTGSLAKDQYRQVALSNVATVANQTNQAQTQNQATQSHISDLSK